MDDSYGKMNLPLGDNAAILPLGFGVVAAGPSVGFDQELVGLLFKGLPDDLCEKAQVGTVVAEGDLERIKETSMDAPTVFIHCKDPKALDDLAEMASGLADDWRKHNGEEAPAEEKGLKELFIELAQHVDYCGYGDAYERECAEHHKLPQRVEAMLERLGVDQ